MKSDDIINRFIIAGAWVIGTIILAFQLRVHCFLGFNCTTISSEQGMRDVLSLVVGLFNGWVVVVWFIITTLAIAGILKRRR